VTPFFFNYYNDKAKLFAFASNIFNVFLLLFISIAITQFIFADIIVKSLLPGFSLTNLELTTKLFRYQAFLSIITILSSILKSLHYTFGNLYRTIIYPTIGTVFQIVFVWLMSYEYGLFALLYGLMISQCINFILLSFPFIREYKFILKIDHNVKDLFSKIIPLLISSSFSKSNIIFDRFFLSKLQEGSMTILQYGEKIVRIISSLLNQGISIVTLTKFSLYQNKDNEFQYMFYSIFKHLTFIICPVLMISINYSEDFFEILNLSNKISSANIKNIHNTFIAFFGILVGGSYSSNMANAFYAKGLTKIISKTTVLIQSLGFVLKFILFLKFGFWGLPIGASVVSIINAIVLYYLYYKYIFEYSLKILCNYFLKILLISIAALFFVEILKIPTFEFSLFNSIINSISYLCMFLFFSLIFEKDVSTSILRKIKLNFKIW